MFCTNIDIDKTLLLDKNKGIMMNSFIVIFLCNSVLLLNHFRNLFILCINIDIDLLL